MTTQKKASEFKKTEKNVDLNGLHAIEHSEDTALKMVDIAKLKQDSEAEKSKQSSSDMQ